MVIKNFDIDNLIKSEGYEEGGTENQPIQRSIKTIATKLIIANKLPPDVVGAAIFKVFSHIAFNNLKFKGDGSYGSKGRELFTSIKNQAIKLTEEKSVNEVITQITVAGLR